MTQHLSADRISELVALGTDAASPHLRECPACRAEAARLRGAVGSFRDAVHNWSALESVGYVARPAPRSSWWRWPVWAFVVLALSVVPLLKNVRDRNLARQAAADALLLEQVDKEVSTGVPASMEPLSQLVVWQAAQSNSQVESVSSEKGEVR